MKIVISETIPSNTSRGLVGGFTSIGHDVVVWNPRATPVFDVFDTHFPDLFIASVEDISRGVALSLQDNPDVYTLFHSKNSEAVSGEVIEYVKQLKEDVDKPDCIFSTGLRPYPWSELGIKTISVPPAADNILFQPTPPDEKWASDVAYVGEYKENLDKYILPLCNQTYSLKIYSLEQTVWPVANYVGVVRPENVKHVYSSSKIIIDVVEPGETSDVPLNAAICGSRCLTNNTHTAFPANVFTFKNPEHLQALVREYAGNFSPYHSSNDVLPTYDDRAKQVLKLIGVEG